MRPRMTDRLVWRFMAEGCNAAEVAAFAGIRESVAIAMMSKAARKFADVRTRSRLKRAA